MKRTANRAAKVFIVGAGPGADDLITLRGLRALHEADVVLYDALISTDLLDRLLILQNGFMSVSVAGVIP